MRCWRAGWAGQHPAFSLYRVMYGVGGTRGCFFFFFNSQGRWWLCHLSKRAVVAEQEARAVVGARFFSCPLPHPGAAACPPAAGPCSVAEVGLEVGMKQKLLPLPSLRLPSSKALGDLMGPIKPLGHSQHPVPCGGCGGVWRWRVAETLIRAGTCPGWSPPGCFLEMGSFFATRTEISKCFPILGWDKKGV